MENNLKEGEVSKIPGTYTVKLNLNLIYISVRLEKY